MWTTKKNKKQKNSSEIFSFISLFRQKKKMQFLILFGHEIVHTALKIQKNTGNMWQ